MNSNIKPADQICAEYFDNYGPPRSPEYRKGCLDTVRHKLGRTVKPQCPYSLGSAQADAWFAGCDLGIFLASPAVSPEAFIDRFAGRRESQQLTRLMERAQRIEQDREKGTPTSEVQTESGQVGTEEVAPVRVGAER
jgi:hypothetical protein